jgi:hypothetical protein
MSGKYLTAFLALCALLSATAFTSQPNTRETTTSLKASRRSFLDAAVTTTAGLAFFAGGFPAFADDGADDLSMPTGEELQQSEVSFLLSL